MVTTIGKVSDRLLSRVVPRATVTAQDCGNYSICTSYPCCGTGPCTRRYHYRYCGRGTIFTGYSCSCAA